MNSLRKRLATLIVACASCMALNSCIIGHLSGGLRYGTETAFITVDGTTHNCETDVSTERYRCVWITYLGPNMTNPVYDEVDIVMTGIDVFTRYVRDPLIVQVPAEATGFTGTINDGPGVTPGTPLSITTGLTSIPIDVNTTLQAEPGMQLVIIDFPSPDTAALGAYGFTVSYSGGGTLFKALFAAKITTGGKTYYPPMYPCVTDFVNMPAIDASFSLERIVPVYTNIGGCTDKVYNFVASGANTVDVIEFYNAALDHYFITWVAQEISDLDTGVHKGWARTGKTFRAFATAQAETSQVCRFYIPPGLGDSHFFGRGQMECDDTARKFPALILEDPMFMQMFLPMAGVCPASTTEVYRVFSNRADANHRYMTDRAVRDVMVAQGWLAEGDGPNLVVMCAPQ